MKRNLLLFYGNNNFYKLILFLLFTTISGHNLYSQGKTLSGTIKAEDGTGIPGVNIIEKGTSNGTATDADGRYTITIADTNAILQLSSMGFANQEVKAGNLSELNIGMESDVQSLSQVVVVGYGTQEREDISGSISSVTAEQIAKVPVTTLDQAIQGRSAGVQVTNNDGSPGSGVNVQIRGVGTFGDNSPLYVVDGYPISGNLNNLNPNDIASMEILKDASATAIYGSRAANGVVIITTKRGRRDGLQFTFDTYVSVQEKPKGYDVLNAQDFVALAKEAVATSKRDFNVDYALPAEWSNPAALRTIDWQDALYQTGFRQNYNIGLRGGSEKVQTAISLGFFDQDGVVKRSDFKRYNATLNLDYTPITWLKSSSSIKYTRTDGVVRFGTGLTGLGLLTRLPPTMTGNPATSEIKDANGNYGYYTLNQNAVSGYSNALADLERLDSKDYKNNLLASSSVEVSILKAIRLKTNFGVNLGDYSGYYFTPSSQEINPARISYYDQSANNTFEWLWENTAAYTKTFGMHNIDFIAGISAQENVYRQIGIRGNGLVSDDLRNSASLQSITRVWGNQQTWALASQFGRVTYKLLDRYILTGTIRRDGSSRFGPGKKWGVFPSVAAAWKIKEESFLQDVGFLSDFKLRASWGQTGNQNIALFQYQETYNSGNGANDNRGYVFGRNKTYYDGIVIGSLPNPNLKWESNTQSDIGLDASFFNNKVTLILDYYNKTSSDFLLNNVPLPSQTGFSEASRNVGSIRNNGFEAMLGYRQVMDDFQWGISGNITTVNNKILSLAPGQTRVSNFSNLNFPNYGNASWTIFSQSESGGQVGSFYGFQTDGIFQSRAEIDALNANAEIQNNAGVFYQNSSTNVGDRKFVDQITLDTNEDGVPDAKDGRITDADRIILGSPIPKFFGGLNLDAAYKGFDISLFFFGTSGNKILNYAKRNLESIATNGGVGIQNVGEDYYLNRWTETNRSNTHPRATREDVNGNTRISDAYVEDGSFIRLRNLQIGYTIPEVIAGKAKMSRARIYIGVQNLFTITKYSGLDPEVGQVSDPNAGANTNNPNLPSRSVTASGIDLGNFPNSRLYTLGLSLQF